MRHRHDAIVVGLRQRDQRTVGQRAQQRRLLQPHQAADARPQRQVAVDARRGGSRGVGAGRVGAVLGAALAAAGHHVVAAAAVSTASRERAARLLPTAEIRPADEVAAAAEDLLLLAVPDDSLGRVVAGLKATGSLPPGQIVAHTSGAHGLGVLGDVPGLALHPAMTFTGEDSPVATLMLSVMGAFAEFERSLIRERQREGIAIAKAKGSVYKGRKPKLDAPKVADIKAKDAAAGGKGRAALAREFSISRETLYQYLNKAAA